MYKYKCVYINKETYDATQENTDQFMKYQHKRVWYTRLFAEICVGILYMISLYIKS